MLTYPDSPLMTRRPAHGAQRLRPQATHVDCEVTVCSNDRAVLQRRGSPVKDRGCKAEKLSSVARAWVVKNLHTWRTHLDWF